MDICPHGAQMRALPRTRQRARSLTDPGHFLVSSPSFLHFPSTLGPQQIYTNIPASLSIPMGFSGCLKHVTWMTRPCLILPRREDPVRIIPSLVPLSSSCPTTQVHQCLLTDIALDLLGLVGMEATELSEAYPLPSKMPPCRLRRRRTP